MSITKIGLIWVNREGVRHREVDKKQSMMLRLSTEILGLWLALVPLDPHFQEAQIRFLEASVIFWGKEVLGQIDNHIFFLYPFPLSWLLKSPLLCGRLCSDVTISQDSDQRTKDSMILWSLDPLVQNTLPIITEVRLSLPESTEV